ncbi:MAG: hypothetical protein U1E61_03810 [Bradyrhizobium sp.]
MLAAQSSIVPYGADQTVFVVTDGCAARGNVECSDLETVVADLLAGKFGDPLRIAAFNTLEHWSRDLSADVAREIEVRCDIEGVPVPEHVRDFLERHGGRFRQAR